MAFVFNPFTGNFDAVTDPVESPFAFPANCQASDSVGDCVHVSGDAVAGVIQVAVVDITDITRMPAVGVITSKASLTSCTVAFFGAVAFSPVLPGRIYFVGGDGKPTSTRPTGLVFIQILGLALDATRLLIQPALNMTRVLA